ncbi:MAG TPA: segregation/condensation protein A, partial [Coxiellaceae bacterium]|nr:segregation/condensation protein A [Coxiellaceae bacterium]
EYERFRQAAINLDELPREERDVFTAEALQPVMELKEAYPDVNFDEITKAMRDVLTRAKLYSEHKVLPEVLSIRERMTTLLERVKADEFMPFHELFTAEEGRMGVVVTLIAILELIRLAALELVQSEPFAPLYVKAKGTPVEIKDSEFDEQ